MLNRTDERVRYLIVASHTTPEVVEYPDSAEFVAYAATDSPRQGKPLFVHGSTDAAGP